MNRHVNNQLSTGRDHIVKRAIIVSIAVVALMALCAVPAFAEGYNNGNWNFTTGTSDTALLDGSSYGANAGQYVRTPAGVGQIRDFSGPHGGYTTTTNKCQDCHSTHYATGSYMLLRADDRTTACDFCHTGGGGSKTNIQMDNQYDTVGVTSTETMGFGTGHTLGYKGNAPGDIDPAFTDAQGLSCFDCHTPHGNSARVLATFADPGRPMGGTVVQNVYRAGQPAGTVFQAGPVDLNTASYVATSNAGMFWGIEVNQGNIVIVKNKTAAETAGGAIMVVQKKPVWPTGRFLLLKDPDANDGDDSLLATSTNAAGMSTGVATKKFAISWDDPIGPADGAYGGDDSVHAANPAGNNVATTNHPWPKGLMATSEMCADCHGGTAGLSNQAANVWKPNPLDSKTGAYLVAYSHDAQPRH